MSPSNVKAVGVFAVVILLIDSVISQDENYQQVDVDYPLFTEVPKGLSFTCDDKPPGYYADPETMCQVWHWCVPGIAGNVQYSFLCGPGTVFNQRTRVCDFYDRVDCNSSPAFYAVNDDLYKDVEGNFIAGKK